MSLEERQKKRRERLLVELQKFLDEFDVSEILEELILACYRNAEQEIVCDPGSTAAGWAHCMAILKRARDEIRTIP